MSKAIQTPVIKSVVRQKSQAIDRTFLEFCMQKVTLLEHMGLNESIKVLPPIDRYL